MRPRKRSLHRKPSGSRLRQLLRRKPRTRREAAAQLFIREAQKRGFELDALSLSRITLYGHPVGIYLKAVPPTRSETRVIVRRSGIVRVLPPDPYRAKRQISPWPTPRGMAMLCADRRRVACARELRRRRPKPPPRKRRHWKRPSTPSIEALRKAEPAASEAPVPPPIVREAPRWKKCFFCLRLMPDLPLMQWQHHAAHLRECGEEAEPGAKLSYIRNRLSVLWEKRPVGRQPVPTRR